MNHDRLTAPPGKRVWVCVVCGFLYKEEFGLPDHGIAAGTVWEDVPENWTCPKCGVSKADFSLLTV